MSLYKRKDSSVYWVKLHHSGKIVQRSTGTTDKVKAQEYHDRLKASLWEQERLGVKPRHSWHEAVVRYLAETKHKASQCTDKTHLRWLDRFLDGQMLDDIQRELLDRIMDARIAENVENSSVNRVNEVLRAVLRKACNEWEWLDRVPHIRMLPESNRRIRWITYEEAEKLITVLPKHLAAMARFSLETGLRRANVTGLQWSQIDLDRCTAWVHADQAKARKSLSVPLSVAAQNVLREQMGKHSTHVFSYQGEPIMQVNTKAWRKALEKVGIENFRWHDLRHTWASWHVQAGTPLHVLKELGGWASMDMVMVYAHLSSSHLTEYVDRLSKFKEIENDHGELVTI
jgi:integrase